MTDTVFLLFCYFSISPPARAVHYLKYYSSKTEAGQRKTSTFRGGNDHVTLDLFSWRLNQNSNLTDTSTPLI